MKFISNDGVTNEFSKIKLLLLETNPTIVYIKMNDMYITDNQDYGFMVIPELNKLSK